MKLGMKQLSETDKAYIAGFFDGEGCVHISLKKRSDGSPYPYGMRMCFTNTNKNVLMSIAETIGIGKLNCCVRKNMKHRDVWLLVVYGKDAQKLLNEIEPYLRLKKNIAVIAQGFQHMRTGQHGMSMVDRASRIMIYERIRSANRKGNS